MPHYRLLLLACLLVALGVPFSSLRAADKNEFFENKVRPLLVQHCYRCHSGQAKKLRGGLRIDSREALLAGGDSGPALVPGQAEKSRLIEAVAYKNVDLQMPPRGKLTEAAIADLTTWVKMERPGRSRRRSGAAAINGPPSIFTNANARTGPGSRSVRKRRPLCEMRVGRAIHSIASSSPSWRTRDCHPRHSPTSGRSSAACIST